MLAWQNSERTKNMDPSFAFLLIENCTFLVAYRPFALLNPSPLTYKMQKDWTGQKDLLDHSSKKF
jgi:hypothetical protein